MGCTANFPVPMGYIYGPNDFTCSNPIGNCLIACTCIWVLVVSVLVVMVVSAAAAAATATGS
jgi:hypothetical protein